MSKNSELAKNTFIIFIGKFCTQFISFLLIPIYTNLLPTTDYGYIDLIQSYISLLVPILILRLDSGIFRFLIDARNNNDEKNSIVTNILFFTLLQIILFTVIFIVINSFFDIKYAFSIGINIIFLSIASILLQLTRGVGDNIGYSIGSIISGVSTILLNILFIVKLGKDSSSILIASGIANIICSLFLFFRNKVYKSISIKNINKPKLKSMLNYSLPMIPDGLSWWIINVSDRSIISFFINTAANGIYAVSSKFSNILSSLFLIFNMSWQESASLHINDKDNEEFFGNIFNTTYKIFFSACIGIMVLMPIVFEWLIGDDYVEAYIYIPLLLLANLYSAVANVIGGIYIAKKNTKSVAKTTLFAALINLAINILMIKKFGLFAAAISTLLSYIALAIYRYIDVQKYIKLKLDYRIFILTMLIFCISGVLYYLNTFILNIINLILTVSIVLILNLDIIKIFINRVRRKIWKEF